MKPFVFECGQCGKDNVLSSKPDELIKIRCSHCNEINVVDPSIKKSNKSKESDQ